MTKIIEPKELGPWSTDDFESLSWHDVHVYGFKLVDFKRDNGSANLLFDIDFILDWQNVEGIFWFSVCQAELLFENVSDLVVSLDYAVRSAGICPFALDGISREVFRYPTGYETFRWNMPVNWPSGCFTFEATGFQQRLLGNPVFQSAQALPRGG